MLYMEIANIHSVRASVDALQSMCEDGSEEKWLSRLEQTGWLRQVHSVLSAGCALARKMANEKMSCLVHCSDGWDRTAQMTSLCQLLLDPYYRTIRGFCVCGPSALFSDAGGAECGMWNVCRPCVRDFVVVAMPFV